MREILIQITKQSQLEAKWLHTLSFLEYMGALKISKTVFEKQPSLLVLEHMADEARHAFVFKKLAVEMGVLPSDYLCKDEAKKYFQTLDFSIKEWIESKLKKTDSYLNYLLTTCAIEHRAMKLYPLYRSVTSSQAVKEELTRIISEEANHKNPIENEALKILEFYGIQWDEVFKMEEKYFEEFSSNILNQAF